MLISCCWLLKVYLKIRAKWVLEIKGNLPFASAVDGRTMIYVYALTSVIEMM